MSGTYDERPTLADLRESGSIEQNADVVMFVFREEYYLEREEPPARTSQHTRWQEEMNDVQGIVEVIISKKRDGPTGVVRLMFQREITKFLSMGSPFDLE